MTVARVADDQTVHQPRPALEWPQQKKSWKNGTEIVVWGIPADMPHCHQPPPWSTQVERDDEVKSRKLCPRSPRR